MHKRTVGAILISIAAFLYGVRLLCAAIYGINVNSWNGDMFRHILGSIGDGPVAASWVALVAGILYLLWAEFEHSLKTLGKVIKKNWNDHGDERDKMG